MATGWAIEESTRRLLYHGQDLERAVDGGGFDLAFSSISAIDADSIFIGKEITETLKKHDFSPTWTGDVKQRIDLPIKWHRRYNHPANTAPPSGI